MSDDPAVPVGNGYARAEWQPIRLIELAARLTTAVTVSEAVDAIVEGCRAELQADNVTVYLLDGTGTLLRLAGRVGMDGHLRQRFEMFPIDDALPAGDALRSGQLISYATRADRNARYTRFGNYEGGAGTVLIAPMVAEDASPIGVLSVGWQDEGRATVQAQALTTAVATLCGRTVVRARQYDVAQRALAAQHILAEASRLLEERHELETTLRAVAALTVPAIADVCVMCLLDERGALRPVVAVTHDDERRAVVDQLIARQPVISNPGLLDVISTAITTHAQVVDRRGDEGVAEDEEHLQLIRALDATSGIVVPLIGPERISGLVLLLVTGDRAPLGQPSLQLAEALASRIAVAVHNTAAYSTLDRRVGQLQQALESRVVIEQAKGVLVARWGITPTAAFHHMRAATRSRRMRIHDLATAVIDGTDDLPAPGTG